MTDCFALLGEPRRPWLDPESLKEKFHKLSATHHPDVAREPGVDFSAINAAYQTLQDPKARLRHLLELEFPDAFTRPLRIPPGIADLFETISRGRGGVASFLEKRAALQSPLEIALLTPEKIELIGAMERLLEILTREEAKIFAQLKAADTAWERDKAGSLEALLEIYQGLSYAGKWLAQVRGDLARLAET